MPERAIVCPGCGEAVPYGRLSCPECGTLLASVAGGVRPTVRTADAPGPDAAAASDGAGVEAPALDQVADEPAPEPARLRAARKSASAAVAGAYVPPARRRPRTRRSRPSVGACRGRRAPAAASRARQGQHPGQGRDVRRAATRRRVARARGRHDGRDRGPDGRRRRRAPSARGTVAGAGTGARVAGGSDRGRRGRGAAGIGAVPARDAGRRRPGAGAPVAAASVAAAPRIDRPAPSAAASPTAAAGSSAAGASDELAWLDPGLDWATVAGAGLIVIGMLLPWSRTRHRRHRRRLLRHLGPGRPAAMSSCSSGRSCVAALSIVRKPGRRPGSAAGWPGSRSAPSRWGSPGRTSFGPLGARIGVLAVDRRQPSS